MTAISIYTLASLIAALRIAALVQEQDGRRPDMYLIEHVAMAATCVALGFAWPLLVWLWWRDWRRGR